MGNHDNKRRQKKIFNFKSHTWMCIVFINKSNRIALKDESDAQIKQSHARNRQDLEARLTRCRRLRQSNHQSQCTPQSNPTHPPFLFITLVFSRT